jgi:NAD(P)-dependent dehydrogenase (short-subunit alcohol dehydrogenase family)
MFALTNKVAIVTGASSGIGRATAVLFAEQGAKVVAAARRQVELDRLVSEISEAGGEAVALAGDVSDEAYAEALVELAVNQFGGLERVATPEEIARSALYLASDASSFTTGAALLADGGISINRV